MEVSRRSWIIGESNRTLWSLVEDQISTQKYIDSFFQCIQLCTFEGVSSDFIVFLCHMYNVLVYKMLWDWKIILNINLWRIIRLSIRPVTGLCPHISLEKILVYTVLVQREFTVWSTPVYCKATPVFEMGVFCEKYPFLKENFPKLRHLP